MPEQRSTAGSNQEAYYRLLVETSADAIITLDERSVIVSANPAAAETFGYSLEELVGRSMTELIPERFRAAHRAGVRRYLATGQRHIPWRGLELPGLRRDGREILLEVAFGEQVEGGQRFFTGTMRDVTERKRSERLNELQHAVTRVLAESRDLAEAVPGILRSIGEGLGWEVGAFWSWDPDGEVLRALDFWVAPDVPAQQFVERSRDLAMPAGQGLPGRVWATRNPVCLKDIATDQNFPRLAVASSIGLHGALAFPVCVGEDCIGVMEFLTRQAPDSDDALLTALAALGSDIGQFIRRMEAEARLRRREEIQRFLSDVGAALTASGLDYNATLRKLAHLAVPVLGDWCTVFLRREDGVVQRLEVAHADPDVEPLAHELALYPVDPDSPHPVNRVVRTGQTILLREIGDEQIRAVARDETHRRLLEQLGIRSAMVLPLSARGRILGALVLGSTQPGRRYDLHDQSVAEEFTRRAALALDNARLYQESLEANRAKSEFLAVMSHELRTPLNAVTGYADLLSAGVAGELPERAHEYAGRIGLAARHLTELIEEVLTFSRLEAGREVVAVEPVRLEDLTAEIQAVAEPLAALKSIHFRVEVPDTPVELLTDARKVRQVLLALVNNAIKFTHQGEVRLTAGLEGDELVLRVCDTGIGIAPEDQQRIFEPFWQVEQGATREVGGTGIGLSVTQRLVEMLGGRIEVQSAPGQGSTFTVRLPRRAPGN